MPSGGKAPRPDMVTYVTAGPQPRYKVHIVVRGTGFCPEFSAPRYDGIRRTKIAATEADWNAHGCGHCKRSLFAQYKATARRVHRLMRESDARLAKHQEGLGV